MHPFPVNTLDQLAAVLQGRRAELAATQKQVGARVGLLPKTISALESRPGHSSVASLFKLLSALDVEIVLQPKVRDTTRGPGTEW